MVQSGMVSVLRRGTARCVLTQIPSSKSASQIHIRTNINDKPMCVKPAPASSIEQMNPTCCKSSVESQNIVSRYVLHSEMRCSVSQPKQWHRPSRHARAFSTTTATPMGDGPRPEVTVDPGGHLLVDDKLAIRVRGLDSGQAVTVHTMVSHGDRNVESCCRFRADGDGVVDLYRHPSLGGSYTGISPMGIFWSLEPTPDMPKGFRLIVKDVDMPLRAELVVYPGHSVLGELRSCSTLAPLARHVLDRWYKSPGVTSTEVTGGQIRGKLFLPPGPGPFPGVIDMFGTVGGTVEFRSALLASHGFASLALPYFMYKDLPKTLEDIRLEYFLEAVSWMQCHPNVCGAGLGVIGVSKGGELGLIMAAHCSKVRAVVNINGPTFVSIAPINYRDGKLHNVGFREEKLREHDDGSYWMKDMFEDYSEKDFTPVWNHNPKVLNIVSEDDKCAPVECIRLMKRCYPPDKVDNFTVLSYPGAGHLVEPPYTPLCRMSYHKSYGKYFAWGGEPKQHADAQEDAWRNILKFLHTNIPTHSSGINSKL